MDNSQQRIVFLDYLRVIACFMVILVHAVEPFYLGGEGTLIQTWSAGFWSTIIDSALRAAVPLFLMASSYLLFPIKQDTASFFKRRFTRVLIPLIVWTMLYALIPYLGSEGEIDRIDNFKRLGWNFLMASGHLWFVYMLVGIYLLMPMLSPWIERISKREEQAFIGLWAFTAIIPLLRPMAEAVTGSPNVWGECSWNEFGTFYYVSGFVGYLVLGHYFRVYVGELSWRKTLAWALPLWAVGYAIAASGFWTRMPKEFPVSAPIDLAVEMETSWYFCSLGVALTTVAYFLVIRKITASGSFYRNIVLPFSKVSYGVYLMHMFILVPVFAWVNSWGLPVPAVMLLATTITFVTSGIIAQLISLLPFGKYIVG